MTLRRQIQKERQNVTTAGVTLNPISCVNDMYIPANPISSNNIEKIDNNVNL